MKSTVEQLSPTRVRINVEVPFDELKPNFDRAYRKLAQQVRIPGFRPGKAPARILETRLGRGAVLDEVVNEAVPAKYGEAVSSGDVRVIGRPEIEVTKIDDGQLLAFTAEVDVRPPIELPDASEISVQVDPLDVTDEQVDEQLEGLRGRFGTLTGVDRAAAEGDFVVIDLSASVDGEPLPDASATGLSYQIGAGGLIDGIDEALTGLSAGESTTFPTTLVAGEYEGREAEVTVTLDAVKERELPEADDEFAQLASQFDTLDELTADLRERLGKMAAMQQAGQARDHVLKALMSSVEVPLPESIVAAELEAHDHDVMHTFEHDEQAFAQWLAEQGKTREEFDADARESAEEAVRTQLVLDAVADAEELSVSEMELTERLVLQAQRSGMPAQEYVKLVQESGQLGSIYADARRNKALSSLVRAATITDTNGDPVDLGDLLGKPDDGDEAAEADTEDDVVATEADTAEADTTEGDAAAAEEPEPATS